MTTPISESKGIPPSEYAAHLDAVLARSHKRRRVGPWLVVLAIVAISAFCV